MINVFVFFSCLLQTKDTEFIDCTKASNSEEPEHLYDGEYYLLICYWINSQKYLSNETV